jgi:hypothetical protein
VSFLASEIISDVNGAALKLKAKAANNKVKRFMWLY